MYILLAIILPESAPEDTGGVSAKLDFAELFRQYYPRVYNYLRYRVNVPADAEDLISIVFEKAYTHREQFDPAKGTFSAWLFRIAHNTLANYYRSHQRRSDWVAEGELPDDLVTFDSSLESRVIQHEAIAHVLQGLARLSERDREVISLKFAGQLSNQEIGQIMDLKEKTVSVVLLRAMRRLQKQMGSIP
ncbi:MAG: RNA polymerase sigma factor [Planctomycetota bacterium]|nr:MAG: RNA polymerase sigma factor [Planctomycetota bacterium]